ncbi:MAG: SurA N-terminal domain-containing protein [Pyrinomonadaceae bacterium]
MHKAIKKITILSLVLLFAVSFAACGSGGASGNAGKPGSAVAATVNGKPITLEEVDRVVNQQAGGQQSQMSQLELAAARLQVLDGLIQQQVLFQRAEKDKLLPTEDEVTAAINSQKTQNSMTEEEYQKMLRESNQTEQSLREVARKQIAVQKQQDRTFGNISISDKEVESFYSNNKQSFVSARGVGLAAIMVDPADNGMQDDAKSDPEAKQKIDIVYQQLKNGADFATVARAKSEDSSSNARGGDLGFLSEEQLKQSGLPPELVARFFNSMQAGDITAPERTSNNRFYIFKLTAKRLQSENLTLESPGVREDIKKALINQRQSLLNAAMMATAMNEAKIENNLAKDMLNSPNNLSGVRPAGATNPSPAASANASPSGTVSPAASPAPSVQGQ